MNHFQTDIIPLKLKIGPYQICPLPTGIFGLDGGAMFGTVPKTLWEKTNPADEKNRIPMEARALLLKGDNGKNIIIDTGNGGDFIPKYGEKLGSKFAELYQISEDGLSLKKSLEKFQLKLTDIHKVILTHLHFDHAGGATHFFDGKLRPTFPNAKYYIQKSNLETAENPNIREKASYFPANFHPLREHKVLTILDGPQQLSREIGLFVCNGHTQGQQLVKISDGINTLVYCGDLIAMSSHIRKAWIMGYDLNPLLVIDEKSQLLLEAAENSWYLFFEHDPYCDSAQIQKQGNDFVITQRYQFI